ncbi:hypothetical protein D3C72_1578670 [compost metagenome]
MADGGAGEQGMIEATQLGPHHQDHRQPFLGYPVRQQMLVIQRQKPAPRPLDDHQFGPRPLNLPQPGRQTRQRNARPHLLRGYVGGYGGLEGIGVDRVDGQREAGGRLQLLGIEVAKPLGGAGTAGGNRLVAGADYAPGGERLQQGTGDQGLAHVGVGARDEIGCRHDDSSAQFRAPVAPWYQW